MRTRFGGVDVADTRCALLMMGGYRPPLYELSNYYLPRADVLETEVDGVVEVPPLSKWTAGIPDRDLV